MVTKAQLISWSWAQGTDVSPPPPPPGITVLRRQDAMRWFDPRLTWLQHGEALRAGYTPSHQVQCNTPKAGQGQSGAIIVIANNTLSQSTYVDNNSNVIISRTTLGGKPAFRHELRQTWLPWFSGNTTMRSRFLTSEYDAASPYSILRATSPRHIVGGSCYFSSESDPSPWPPIRQLILDFKQPTSITHTVGFAYNSQPRLEIMPGGVMHVQALRLNAGQTTINPTGSNASIVELWNKQLEVDTWYDFAFLYNLAPAAAGNPYLEMWFSKGGAAATKEFTYTQPNSYNYADSATGVTNGNFTFLLWGVYDWDYRRGYPNGDLNTSWGSQVMYSGLFLAFDEGVGTPAATPQLMMNTLRSLRA